MVKIINEKNAFRFTLFALLAALVSTMAVSYQIAPFDAPAWMAVMGIPILLVGCDLTGRANYQSLYLNR